MISTLKTFSERLHQLDPDDVAFVRHIDGLVEETDPTLLNLAYTVVFPFFESHPENDAGAPGTLVHMMEGFYPNYVDELVASVNRIPSVNTLLMLNRILNSRIDDDLRARLVECLRAVTGNPLCSPLVHDEAYRYHQRHVNRIC